jgi:hypothetical protein
MPGDDTFDRALKAVRAEVAKLDFNDPGWEDAVMALLKAKGFEVTFEYDFDQRGMTKQ